MPITKKTDEKLINYSRREKRRPRKLQTIKLKCIVPDWRKGKGSFVGRKVYKILRRVYNK